ncbi:DUF4388 domain-containing protein [bacterium]|nr:DUF4388 domain-containing protein [bacterium]
MGFTGHIDLISMNQVINLLHEGKRSGSLYVRAGELHSRFVFRFGEMVHGSSSAEKASLFDFFIEQGIFSEVELETLKQGKTRSLTHLIADMSPENRLEIAAALQARAKIILFETLYWDKGSYEFQERDWNEEAGSRLEKEISDLQELSDESLNRIIRLKWRFPFKEMVFSRNPDYDARLSATYSANENRLLGLFDGKKSLNQVLDQLEGERLYNLLALLTLIEGDSHGHILRFSPPSPTRAWEEKIADFTKVYEGSFRKISTSFQRYFGRQSGFYWRHAFQEAIKDSPYLWQTVKITSEEQVPLDFVNERIHFFPVEYQLRFLKNAYNSMILWQLITLKNYAGPEAVNHVAGELDTIFKVLGQKGSIHHKEIARDIPYIFTIVKDFPTWIDQGTVFFKLKRFEDALILFKRIPSSHPEYERILEYRERIEQQKLMDKGSDTVLYKIFKTLMENDVLQAEKLLAVLQENDPQHPEIATIRQQIDTAFAQMRSMFCDLTMVPQLSPDFDFSQINTLALTQAQGFLLSRIDGLTTIKNIFAISGLPKNEVIFHLYQLKQNGLITLPVKPSEPSGPIQPGPFPVKPAPEMRAAATAGVSSHDRAPDHTQTSSEASPALPDNVSAGRPSSRSAQVYSPAPPPKKDQIKKQKTTTTAKPKSASQMRKAEADVFFQKGLTAMGKQDYQTAIASFEKSIEKFAGGVAYYHYLDQARQLLKEHQATELIDQTRTYYQNKKLKEAISCLQQALTLNPRNQELLQLSVTIWLAAKHFKHAERALLAMLEMEPGNADYYVELGKLYREQSDLIRAREQFMIALQWNKRHTEAHRQLNMLP